jgi:lipid A ethanolaminephosphotransferase
MSQVEHISSRWLSWQMTRLQLLLATALWISFIPNLSTLQAFFNAPSAGTGWQAWAFALGGWLFVLVVIFTFLVLLGVFFWGRSVKVLCALFVLLAAVLGFYTQQMGVRWDRVMVLNVLQTHPAEALELFNGRILAWFVVIGVLPAWALSRVKLVAGASWLRRWLLPVGVWVVLVAACTALVFSMYSRYASATRNRDVSFHTIAPANVIMAALHHAYLSRESNQVKVLKGLDAKQKYALKKPRLFVLVLGETARASNHGLNGYARDTTPRMKAAGGIYFPDTQSCGTATAISVPCIFSGLGREAFSLSEARNSESLIDVALRAGVRVIWRDNDSGCKGVCEKADYVDLTNTQHPKWCLESGNCFDEILLEGLEPKLREQTKDTFLVLHIKGSHGPSYYKRYPPAFERFAPTCQSSDLSSCDRQALINGYDNTIVYTDHVVGEVIQMLDKMSDQFATAMVYASDHGESLGESGLYLHGMPYALAPKEQTRVPMYTWVSPQFMKMEDWDGECMKRQSDVQRSHDNIYSTILGFLEISTKEYKQDLDLFKACDGR